MKTIISVPCGNNEIPIQVDAVVIYHTKGAVWAVTKLVDSYWEKYNISKRNRHSTVTYIGQEIQKNGKPAYGYAITLRKDIYYKGIPVSERHLTQKEAIAFCKMLNKEKHTYATLQAMDPTDRRKLFGTL